MVDELGLPFSLEDIEYILVKDKGNIPHVNDILQKYFPMYSTEKGRKPYIITYDEIKMNIIGIEHHKS